ncbi:MAG: YceI family protein [Cypionkella sp.]|jgi:polyisoprenoid-binding protein YceI
MTLFKAAALAASAFAASPVLAADTFTIDPNHVWVTFSVNHAGWSQAQGIFHTVSGSITFDKDDVTKSAVTATIDATSLDTNFDQRNKDLSSPDFLNTAEFSTITFTSTAVEKTGDKTGKVTGTLDMIGASVPVTLDVTFNNEGPDPFDPTITKIGFSATGVVKPADFSMGKVADYGLGPDVVVTINAEAYK